ncbi:ABC transporter permease [Bosea caraganae]|uniref:ABC transporter permease n=1 Tax=Bosea caraganae TaxID=2763117 RepID=A0A370L3Q9_9HYPH|nr:ABC transporter permease [Bosea caraganae]RDJ23077.1 ABC transporter permease [Bosea caraganae]RDJ28857.1 ABC transporter permease [Bosea caraganae]
MLSLIGRRILIAIPTLFLVSLFVFALQRALPGDPFLVIAGEERDPAVIAHLREVYRMDDPIVLQFFAWLGQVVQGDFGRSLRTGEPVLGLIIQKLGVTFQLAVASMLVAVGIGLPAGIIAARRKDTMADYTASAVALFGLSVPHFWLGIMLILVVSVQWKLLPASGFESIFVDPKAAIERLIMPAFVLGGGLAAFIMRHTRSAMLEVLRSDYVRTARAKGLDEDTVVNRHALRNALVPIITLSTLLFGELLAGAVLTEQVFTIPGFGKLIVDAVFNRDYGVVQGVVLCTAIGFILMNLLADVLYVLVNPRLRSS